MYVEEGRERERECVCVCVGGGEKGLYVFGIHVVDISPPVYSSSDVIH